MKKVLSFFKMVVFYLSLSSPFFLMAENFEGDLGFGYRQDKLIWELAGEDVPVLSRLSWKHLKMAEVSFEVRQITNYDLYFHGLFQYARIFSGDNQDSDFRLQNEKIVEYSRSKSDAGQGKAWDFSAGLGYYICSNFEKFRWAPLIGYSLHEQHLSIFNGYQKIAVDAPGFVGRHLSNLHSSYQTRWQGPWLGSDFFYLCNENFNLKGSFEYHWFHYYAKGHWNLRSDFAGDFSHLGHGKGCFGTFGFNFKMFCDWHLGGLVKYNYCWIRHGKDRTPIFIGNSIVYAEGKLKRIEWQSLSALLTIGYYF